MNGGKSIVKAKEAKDDIQKVVEKENKSEESSSSSSSTSDNSDDGDKADWILKKKKLSKKKKEVKKKDEICPLLIQGKCPHGQLGKECEYQHKKLCFRYCGFGSRDMHRAGCGYGEECHFLHPKLCQNSVKMRVCLSDSCTYTHLRYTKRGQQNDVKQPQRFNKPRSFNQRENMQSNDGFSRNQNMQSNDGFSRNQNRQEAPKFPSSDTYAERASGPRVSQSMQNSGSYNPDYRAEEQKNNQHFLLNAMERMQKQLSAEIQSQIEMQFQQLQATKKHETDYPLMQNPAMKYQKPEMFRQQGLW